MNTITEKKKWFGRHLSNKTLNNQDNSLIKVFIEVYIYIYYIMHKYISKHTNIL